MTLASQNMGTVSLTVRRLLSAGTLLLHSYSRPQACHVQFIEGNPGLLFCLLEALLIFEFKTKIGVHLVRQSGI